MSIEVISVHPTKLEDLEPEQRAAVSNLEGRAKEVMEKYPYRTRISMLADYFVLGYFPAHGGNHERLFITPYDPVQFGIRIAEAAAFGICLHHVENARKPQ